MKSLTVLFLSVVAAGCSSTNDFLDSSTSQVIPVSYSDMSVKAYNEDKVVASLSKRKTESTVAFQISNPFDQPMSIKSLQILGSKDNDCKLKLSNNVSVPPKSTAQFGEIQVEKIEDCVTKMNLSDAYSSLEISKNANFSGGKNTTGRSTGVAVALDYGVGSMTGEILSSVSLHYYRSI